MEFLRFGSSIPGSYWGCCACCIIQNFKVDPDAKASIELIEGDGGVSLGKFAGKTYKEIFLQRLRYGTFGVTAMPNHAFIAILARSQITSGVGKKWLAILKAEGFEFVRAVNNSVWNQDNYIFMLVRNVGPNAVKDQFTPPKEWLDLPHIVPEPWQYLDPEVVAITSVPTGKQLTADIAAQQKPLYNALPKNVFYTEAQLEAEGVPITYAGKRPHMHGSPQIAYPQQTKAQRETFKKALEAMKPAATNAFPSKPMPTVG